MDKDFYEVHKRAVKSSQEAALRAVRAMNLPSEIAISEKSFVRLGPGINRRVKRVIYRLQELHGEDLPKLIGLSVQLLWFSLHQAAAYMGSLGNSKQELNLATPEGYAEYEGWAYSFYNGLVDIEEIAEHVDLRGNTPFKERVSAVSCLEAIALYWFAKAADQLSIGNIDEVIEWTYEACDALNLASGIGMFDAGAANALENEVATTKSTVRTEMARAAASSRHAPNYAAKEKVFRWCDENISRFNSMDDAAMDIAETFVPQKFRAVREWMTEWKKLRSASRP